MALNFKKPTHEEVLKADSYQVAAMIIVTAIGQLIMVWMYIDDVPLRMMSIFFTWMITILAISVPYRVWKITRPDKKKE